MLVSLAVVICVIVYAWLIVPMFVITMLSVFIIS